jgi:tape measure domain-containing protein
MNVLGGELEFQADIDLAGFSAQFSKMETQINSLTQEANKNANAIEGIYKKAALAIGSYATFTAASNFVSDIVRVRAEYQNLEVAFQTMLGSKEKADQLMGDIGKLATQTPFDLQEVATAAKTLLAFNTSAEEIPDTLRRISDIASGIGAPLGEIAEIYGKVRVQGRLFAEDINQLTGRGIPVIQELAKQFGVADGEIKSLVENGKVGFPQIEKAFQSLTNEGGKFYNLSEAQSKTLSGQLSALGDAWSQMLNEFGKGGEGVFSESISTITSLVKNYETVLDVLKVLILTYGSYKAAVLSTIALKKIDAAITGEITIAERLRAGAALASQKALALLNKTMLANPAVLVATGIAALVSALVIFNNTASETERTEKRLNEVRQRSQEILVDEKSTLESLLSVAKDESASKEARRSAIEKLNRLAPEYLGNLTIENVRTQEGIKIINDYIKALDKKAKAQAADETLKDINKEIIKANSEYKKALADRSAAVPENLKAKFFEDDPVSQAIAKRQAKTLSALNKEKEAINAFVKADIEDSAKKKTTNVPTVRNEQFLKDEIERIKGLRAPLAVASREYKAYTEQINKLQNEINPQKAAKAALSAESKINTVLDERKGLLQSIADLQRGADQSGMVEEISVLDRINEKYDSLILRINEYNEKARKNGVQGIGLTDINTLNEARQKELRNANLKQDAELYSKNLQEKKLMFERFEASRRDLGIETSRLINSEDTKGFENYIQFLQTEISKLSPKIAFGIANIGDMQKFKALYKELSDTTNETAKRQQEDLSRLILSTQTFAAQRKQIEENHSRDIQNLQRLRGKLGEEEYNNRVNILNQALDEEVAALESSITRSSALYRKLGKDTINLTRQQIRNEIKVLEDELRNNKNLTPQVQIDVKQAIDKLKGLIEASEEANLNLERLIQDSGKIGNAFSTLADSVRGMNSGLADSLDFVASMSNGLTQAASQLKEFKKAQATGDAAGQFAAGAGMVGTAVSIVSTIVNIFKASADSIKQAKQQMADFQTQAMAGELDYNQSLRERLRLQAGSNDLTLKAIEAQRKLLDEQKKSVQAEADGLLKRLQSEQFISGQKTVKTGGSGLFGAVGSLLGFGKKTEVENQLSSLAGRTFEEIEKLYRQGKLTDNAKALFEQLQKIKQEGADVNSQLEELRGKSQEVFTGTTADSITDSIADGFANGLRSVSDFGDKTEDIIRKAMLNALKYQALEDPIKKLYEQFAADAESGGGLDTSEIDRFTDNINQVINDAAQFAEQIQQATGISLANVTASNQNGLAGSIKASLTEETGTVLAGQIGGMRLTAIEQLNVARSSLQAQLAIETNTALTVTRLEQQTNKMYQWFMVQGIKVQ